MRALLQALRTVHIRDGLMFLAGMGAFEHEVLERDDVRLPILLACLALIAGPAVFNTAALFMAQSLAGLAQQSLPTSPTLTESPRLDSAQSQ